MKNRDFSDFRDPAGTPKSTKKWARERKSASGDVAGSVFYRFFLLLPFGVALGTDFDSIVHRKSRLNRKRFFMQAPVFLDGATSKIVCNLHIETHLFMFTFFTFLTEKTTKIQCKTASGNKGRKTPPEDPPETRFGTQNR